MQPVRDASVSPVDLSSVHIGSATFSFFASLFAISRYSYIALSPLLVSRLALQSSSDCHQGIFSFRLCSMYPTESFRRRALYDDIEPNVAMRRFLADFRAETAICQTANHDRRQRVASVILLSADTMLDFWSSRIHSAQGDENWSSDPLRTHRISAWLYATFTAADFVTLPEKDSKCDTSRK